MLGRLPFLGPSVLSPGEADVPSTCLSLRVALDDGLQDKQPGMGLQSSSTAGAEGAEGETDGEGASWCTP